MSNELEALKADNEALKDRLSKLENQINPPPSEPWVRQQIDYTAGMSMERGAMQAISAEHRTKGRYS